MQKALIQYLESLQRAGLSGVPQMTPEQRKQLEELIAAREESVSEPERSSAPQPSPRAEPSTPAKPTHAAKPAHVAKPARATKPTPQPTARPVAAKTDLFGNPVETKAKTVAAPQVSTRTERCTLSREERIEALSSTAERVAACTRCGDLARSRTQTVFGVGNPEASVMFIGEAPGAEEDRRGVPFIGPAGQLLDKIVTAAKMTREEIYICNILRCRPPGNRNPKPDEAANCREYLDAQIDIVDPDYILCWGSIAAKNLLGVETSIGKMRQKWYRYGPAKVLCTYHPSYLLRNPNAKKLVWDDVKFWRAEMGVEL